MGFKTVCFKCQKAFNLRSDFGERERQSLKCPECGELAIRLTHRFRPPKKTDTKKWQVVQFLYAAGFDYEHIYVNYASQGKYPETMKEAQEFVERFKDK